MKRLFLLAPFLIASFSFAQQTSTELGKLRENYTRAIERATSPIKSTYVLELKKLMERHTKAGNLDAALEVKAELEAVAEFDGTSLRLSNPKVEPVPPAGQPVPPASPSNPEGKRLTRSELKEIEKRFVNCLWVDVEREWQMIFFRSDGTATRVQDSRTGKKQNFIWAIREDGVVTNGDRFFTFPNAEQGQWHVPVGATIDVINLKIVPGGKDPEK